MPFIGGQFVYNDDFNYGDRFRQAYDGAQLRSATRDARRAYADGDADRAAEILTPYDMQQGQAYATLADKTALRNAGRAYAGGDYEEAGRIFGERGNVQGVEAARTAGNNAKFSRQLQTANRYRGELRRIKAMPPEAQQSAYEQLLAKAGSEAEGPEGQAFIAQLRQQLPQWGEEAFNAIDNILLTTAQAYATDSPEAFVENWVAQQRAAREEERLRLEGRKVDALEARTEAQIARMERMGSGGGGARWRPMTPDELSANNLPPGTSALIDDETGNVKTLRSQRQYTEGASAAASFAARMRAAIIELRRAEQDPKFKIQDTLNPVTLNPAAQRWLAAARDLINAQLRRESGAAIGPSEFSSARQQYLATPLDWGNQGAREAKYNRLNGMFRAMREQSQGAYDEWYGEPGSAENPLIGNDGNPQASRATGGAGANRNVTVDY